MSTKRISSIAILTALSILFNIFTLNMRFLQVSFIAIPAFIAGGFFGPIAGFAVGALGDGLAGFIQGYMPNPIIALASGLIGFIPGILFKYTKMHNYLKILLSSVLYLIICTAGLNTFALYLMFSTGKTYLAFLGSRLAFQGPVLAINTAILIFVWKPLTLLAIRYNFIKQPQQRSIVTIDNESKQE